LPIPAAAPREELLLLDLVLLVAVVLLVDVALFAESAGVVPVVVLVALTVIAGPP
jgi:hypothetical protein